MIAGLAAAPHPAAADTPPVAFISDIGNQALAVIRSDMPLSGKAAYFDQMIHHDFDLTGISRFVLGPYWRMANLAERHEFRDLFADDLIRVYGRRLAQAGGGSFIVTSGRTIPDGVLVTSRIIPPRGSPIAMDWRLRVSDGLYKIEDVAIDGVGMAMAERSEFAAIIARDGGQFRPLLATMREEG